MPRPSMPDIPLERHHEIVNFIVQCVRDEDLDGHGVPGKRLRKLYFDHYLDDDRENDDEYVAREKILVVDIINHMMRVDRILKGVHRQSAFHLVLHPAFKSNNQENEVQTTEHEASDDLENRRTPTAESSDGAAEREWIGVQKSMDAAYAEMTRGATPLTSNPPEQLSESASRKRRRVEGIAASDASSSFDPISPERYAQSDPRRPLRRLSTPSSETRRRSAPSRLFRPLTPILSQDDVDNSDEIALKQENTYTGPAWLIPALENLHLKYPDDMFKAEGEGIQCLDCEGRTFTSGVNRTASNFERHLNGKQHRANVTARMLQAEKPGMQESFAPSFIPTMMDFNFPPAPLAVFANKSNSSFEGLRTNMNQYFVALENDAASKAVRSNMLEERMAASEQRNLMQLEKLSNQLEGSDSRNEEKLKQMNEAEQNNLVELEKLSDQLAASEAQNDERLQHAADELAASEERSRDRLDGIVEQSMASEERNKTRFEDLSDRLARSEKRCRDEAENLSVRFTMSENSNKALLSKLKVRLKTLEQINEKQGEYIHDLESQSQLHAEELQRQREREEEFRRTCLAQMELQTQKMLDQIKNSDVAHSQEIKSLVKQFAERFRSLEDVKEKQTRHDQILNTVVPQILQDTFELSQQIEKLPARRSTSRRASSHSRPKVRHVSWRASANT